MLSISNPAGRWGRDPFIAELIQHFDQPNRDSWEKLKTSEVDEIAKEIARCQDNFEYAAKNYFWITNKDTGDQLFRLWESQELILDEIWKIRAKGIAQKLIVLKARQLGVSTLAESLVGWSTMFFPNTNGLVVSRDSKHAQYLFGIMLHIYDQLPWWLKPMIAKRKYDDGLFFDNPDEEARRSKPGVHSGIDVQAATQGAGIGQGRRLTAVHLSEIGDWPEDTAREAVEGDIKEALAEKSTRTFAIIESTAKGAGTYYHDLWKSSVDLGDRSEWHTIFLPWFFEKTRFIAPEIGWRPDKPELDMRERIQSDWTRCDNSVCGRWKETVCEDQDWTDQGCPYCSKGILRPFVLSDPQLRFMWQKRINSEKDSESAKNLKQELASTATEAFQLSGHQVFPVKCLDFVDKCVRKKVLAEGFIDSRGAFHGVKSIKRDLATGTPMGATCWTDNCTVDHRFDDKPLKIWEFPEPGHEYVIGADVAEGGGGKADYSVGFVNRIGQAPSPDVHVATYRSNTIDPIAFASVLNFLGRMYNEAMLSIEYNKFDTCANWVRYQYQYPNLFRWKHLDNAKDPLANKWHWFTQMNTKPRLWQTGIKWLREELWVVRSENFAQEMKTFQKEDWEERGASAATNFHDDEIMAGLIALYTAHDMDFSDELGAVRIPGRPDEDESGEYEMYCIRCTLKWLTGNPNEWSGCKFCGYLKITGTPVGSSQGLETVIWPSTSKALPEFGPVAEDSAPLYDQL